MDLKNSLCTFGKTEHFNNRRCKKTTTTPPPPTHRSRLDIWEYILKYIYTQEYAFPKNSLFQNGYSEKKKKPVKLCYVITFQFLIKKKLKYMYVFKKFNYYGFVIDYNKLLCFFYTMMRCFVLVEN